MTLDELRAEADKMGYKLVKKQEQHRQCKCGSAKRRKIIHNGDTLEMMCPDCGTTVSVPLYNSQATPRAFSELTREWNKIMSE